MGIYGSVDCRTRIEKLLIQTEDSKKFLFYFCRINWIWILYRFARFERKSGAECFSVILMETWWLLNSFFFGGSRIWVFFGLRFSKRLEGACRRSEFCFFARIMTVELEERFLPFENYSNLNSTVDLKRFNEISEWLWHPSFWIQVTSTMKRGKSRGFSWTRHLSGLRKLLRSWNGSWRRTRTCITVTMKPSWYRSCGQAISMPKAQ